MIGGANRFAVLAAAAVLTAGISLFLVALVRSPANVAAPASATSLPSSEPTEEGLRRADSDRGELRSAVDVDGSPASESHALSEVQAPAQSSTLDVECALEILVVRRGSGVGIKDAHVEVRTQPAVQDPSTLGETILSLGTAQADGRIVLLLPAGHQTVRAWNEMASGVTSLDLAPGERHTVTVEVDSVLDLIGRVVSAANGLPIQGARVWLDQAGPGGAVQSDDLGQFVFSQLPATGRGQVLQVRAVGYSSESVQVKAEIDGSWTTQLPWLAGEGDLPPAAPGPRAVSLPKRTLRASALDRVSGLRSGNTPPALVADISLEPQRTLVGRIVDDRGSPIQGAVIEARGHYVVRLGMAFPDRSASRSQIDGRFEVTGLRQDVTYQLESSAAGHATTRTAVPPSRTAVDDYGTISLSGELGLAGKVLDSEGSPVEDILVRAVALIGQPTLDDAHRELWPRDPGYREPQDRVAHTDRLGTFELPQMAVGSWKITVEGDDRAWLERTIDLEAGGISHLELQLPPEALALCGRVSQFGAGKSGVRILARAGNDHRKATSGADGTFRLVGLRSATSYSLTASTWLPGASRWEEATLVGQVANPVPYELEMTPRTNREP